MQRIILHVGHGKTGSTALQSSFALSIDALAKAGVYYPQGVAHDEAAAGKINSGNVVAKHLLSAAAEGLRQPCDAVLLSNESLFHNIVADEKLLHKLVDRGVPVDIVLYCRNPMSHAISAYGQMVKRGGSTDTLADFLPRYTIPTRVGRFIKIVEDSGARLHALNYSNHSATILSSFETAAGIAPNTLQAPPYDQINRSLSRSESYLQRAFNGAWGAKSSQFISDALCNALPDIKSEPPALSKQAYNAFAKKIAKPLAQANAMLPQSEQLALERYADIFGQTGPDDLLTFETRQIDILAEAISARIPNTLENDAFRDFVIAAKAGKRLSASDIGLLTDIAVKLRPEAAQLTQKQAALQTNDTFVPDRKALLRSKAKRILRALGLY